MADNWRNVLQSKNSDLERLQEMNAALDEEKIAADMDKILNRPSHVGYTSSIKASTARESHTTPSHSAPPPAGFDSDEDDPNFGDIYGKDFTPTPTKRTGSASKLVQNPLATPSIVINAGKAPETADRFIKAKVTMLTKQLEDGLELRKKMEEQNRDLQRQLKTERDENKNLNKRINLLETELRKCSGERRPRGGAVQETNNSDAAAVDALTQDVANLKKELETAERIAKAADSSVKTKDSQLKRAAETISKFKTQLQEAQLQMQGGALGDRAKLDASENRVKVLEKQRAELLEGFRKQMKLIDILKRQKVHIEAARLLSFTEEEFMKTLDWKI